MEKEYLVIDKIRVSSVTWSQDYKLSDKTVTTDSKLTFYEHKNVGVESDIFELYVRCVSTTPIITVLRDVLQTDLGTLRVKPFGVNFKKVLVDVETGIEPDFFYMLEDEEGFVPVKLFSTEIYKELNGNNPSLRSKKRYLVFNTGTKNLFLSEKVKFRQRLVTQRGVMLKHNDFGYIGLKSKYVVVGYAMEN